MTPTQDYFEAARKLATLRKQQADLQTTLDELMTPIAQAEAANNKARDALLREIETGKF